jgi:glycosyltransferase involved in cell wall biosynthesis
MHWHILDTGSIWLKEFAAALGTLVPTLNWCPHTRNLGYWEDWERTERISDPPISTIRFPIQRGYGRFPISHLLRTGNAVADRLIRNSEQPDRSTLICTSPFYAPVAERWPGRIVYYLTDLTKEYAGMNPMQVVSLDRRMCKVADAVCPNSLRIAEYLMREGGCDKAKLTVIPNATRAENVADAPLLRPAELPVDIVDLPRPIVGVIGNLAGNMDWCLLKGAIENGADISWVFVGPTSMEIADPIHRRARKHLLGLGGRVRFLGPKSYGQLCRYARSFDAALMPYRKNEPTYSGSATRFYEHLAACRPILSSRGFHELLSKEPLVKLVDTAEELLGALDQLRDQGFQDGFEELRWMASHHGTWLVRARDLVAAATLRDQAEASRDGFTRVKGFATNQALQA